MRGFIKRVLEPFNRSHSIFISTSALVMIFPLISAPIVARLYSPVDFGTYAVFYSVSTILSGISSLAMSNVVLLEKERTDAVHGSLMAVSVVCIFSLFLMCLLHVLPFSWVAYLLGTNIIPYIYWIPAIVFMMGVSQVLYTWAGRENEYSILARNKFILGLSTMLLQIGIGLTEPGAIGFIIANLLGLMLAVSMLANLFFKSLRAINVHFTPSSALTQFRRHVRLALWTMPGTLINTFSQFLPDLLINRFFGAALLGQYSLAARMLNMPIAFLSVSIQDFFRQQASSEFNKSGHAKSTFWRFILLTLIAVLFLILPFILILPYVLPIFLGAYWTEAGTLIQAIAFLVIVRFVSSPISYIWLILGRQRLDFLWQIGLLGISFVSLFLPPILDTKISLNATLLIYSIAVGSWYLLSIAISYYLTLVNTPRINANTEK